MRAKRFSFLAIAFVVLAAGMVSARQEKADDSGLETARAFQEAFVRVAERARPAVVMIDTEQIVDVRVWDPFERFRNPFQSPGPRVERRRREGLGSGFVFRSDGYIITNNHVIRDVDKITVHFEADDEGYPAELIGVDPGTDLAVVKIEGEDFPTIPLGDSGKIRVGEWAIAIGAPFGQIGSVSVGVVSATGRRGFNLVDYEDFIQTDTAINPGNSGGPLLNIEGEAIGINTFIIRPDAAQNMGFAVPINMFRMNEEQLVDEGKVSRGWLGVAIDDISEEAARYYGLDSAEGVLITGFVGEDSPAEAAGLAEGDVIVSVDGRPVADRVELQMLVASANPGDTVSLGVVREGQRQEIPVTLGERPARGSASVGPGPDAARQMGMRVGDITPEIQRQLQLESAEGVVIMEVEPSGPADRVRLQPGDVIVGVDKREVADLSDFNEALSAAGDRAVIRLRVLRSGVERFYFVERKTDE